jgi:hypothetical protein
MPNTKCPVVEQVFLVYRDGRLISYASINTDEHFDEDIVGGMLTAVMKLISYSFGEMDEDVTNIDKFKFGFGGRSLLLEMGENFVIAIVILGEDYEPLLAKTRVVVRDIEKKYGSVLDDWPGELDDFNGVDDIIIRLLSLDDFSEAAREAVRKGGIKEKVFTIWSRKYADLIHKSVIPGSRILRNMKLDFKFDYKKKPAQESKEEASSEQKDND